MAVAVDGVEEADVVVATGPRGAASTTRTAKPAKCEFRFAVRHPIVSLAIFTHLGLPTIRDTEKAIHQGWGADASELTAEVSGEADAQAAAVEAADDSGWGAPAADASAWDAPAGETAPAPTGGAAAEAGKEGKEGGHRRRDEEEEEEDNTVTYEEYIAKQKADASSAVPKLEGTRTVGETEWKDAVQLLREESEDVYFAGKVS